MDAELFILGLFWPIIRSPDGKWITWFLRATYMSSVLAWVSRRYFANRNIGQQELIHKFLQRFNTKCSGKPMLEGCLSLITLMAVIGFSYGVAVLPESDNEKQVTKLLLDGGVNSLLSVQPLQSNGQRYFRLTEWLFDRIYLKDAKGNIQKDEVGRNLYLDSTFHRNLRLREKLLVAYGMKPEDIANLVDGNKKLQDESLTKTVGLILRGRDLSHADFTSSTMPKVDFRTINGVYTNLRNAKFGSAKLFNARMSTARLQGAYLWNAQLHGADLNSAKLQGANFMEAKMKGVDLRGAMLIGANLNKANLQEALLIEAELQDATLYEANLQGAYLRDAKLLNADLRYAKLQGADLENAFLLGADLEGAFLQGANLDEAILLGADLENTNLQGANLWGAKLSGANLKFAKLQGANLSTAMLIGADLSNAKLQGTYLLSTIFSDAYLEFANITLSNISGAKFNKLSKHELEGVFEMISGDDVKTELLDNIKNNILNMTKQPASLSKAKGKKILGDYSNKIVLKVFGESEGKLEAVKSELEYQNSLTELLIEIACKNKWKASGIIRYRVEKMPLETCFAQRLLSLKNMAINKPQV